MSTTKEPSLAFAPTPNDDLYSPIQNQEPRTSVTTGKSTARSSFYSRRDEAFTMSPSQLHQSVSADPQTPQLARNLFIQKRSPPTNSLLPPGATDGPEPDESTFWYNLHLETLENFERERITWKKMANRLRQDMDKLKAELDEVRNGSRHDSAFSSNTHGKDNDKIFFNSDTVNNAQDKLKEFSVVSPRGSTTSPDRVSSPVAVNPASRKSTSGAMRLPSISEDEAMALPRRVSIAEPSVTGHILSPFPETSTSATNDDPLSPPSTAKPTSPPPLEYTLDAGHTPRRTSTGNSWTTKRPNVRNNSVAQGVPHDGIGLEEAIVDEIDDDPELRSPKILPTKPSHGSSDMLAALNEKLEEIALRPEENEPEVIKTASPDLPDGTANDGAETSLPDRGIKLKKKPSLNFGAQLGQLR